MGTTLTGYRPPAMPFRGKAVTTPPKPRFGALLPSREPLAQDVFQSVPAKTAAASRAEALVASLRQMDAARKIDWIGQLTGDQSRYSQYARHVLLEGKPPGAARTLELFRPEIAPGVGYKEAMTATGIGLLALALVLPVTAALNPAVLAAALLAML